VKEAALSYLANYRLFGIYQPSQPENGATDRHLVAKQCWKSSFEQGETTGKMGKRTNCMSTILPLIPEAAKLSELRNDGERFRAPKKRVRRLGDAPAEIMLRASTDAFDCIPRVKVSTGEVNTLMGRDVDKRDGIRGRPLSVCGKGLVEYIEATSNAEPREDLRARARFSSRRRCWRSSRSSLRTSKCSTIMPFSKTVTSRL
jgi:hypothetical protein